jgi:hypothetical protein
MQEHDLTKPINLGHEFDIALCLYQEIHDAIYLRHYLHTKSNRLFEVRG